MVLAGEGCRTLEGGCRRRLYTLRRLHCLYVRFITLGWYNRFTTHVRTRYSTIFGTFFFRGLKKSSLGQGNPLKIVWLEIKAPWKSPFGTIFPNYPYSKFSRVNENNSKRNWIKSLIDYRPGQPNWECTMWKFQDFSATQILRQINFGHIEAPKTANLTIWAALNVKILDI